MPAVQAGLVTNPYKHETPESGTSVQYNYARKIVLYRTSPSKESDLQRHLKKHKNSAAGHPRPGRKVSEEQTMTMAVCRKGATDVPQICPC